MLGIFTAPQAAKRRGFFAALVDGMVLAAIGIPLGVAAFICLHFDARDVALEKVAVSLVLAPLGYWRIRGISQSEFSFGFWVLPSGIRAALVVGLVSVALSALLMFGLLSTL